MRLFRWFAARKGPTPVPDDPRPGQVEAQLPAPVTGIRTEVQGNTALVTVDLDEFGPEARPLLLEEMAQGCGLPVFEGTVDHGYSMRSVGSHARCPRCNAATRRQMAHFIYATDIAPRVMFAPAGHFCTACPTVIVDENLIASGAKEGYSFRAVVGVDYVGKKPPDCFRTWNGHPLTYILDEDEQVMDVATDDRLHVEPPMAPALAKGNPAARKRHRKKARQSREQNRR